MIDLAKIHKVHFIGIGGIGISAIARMFLGEGKIVSGSDRSESKVTEELRAAGATIFLEQKADNVPADTELVVYTIAIPVDNPEFVRAKELGVPMLSYPEALGLVSAQKYTIAVSGTHGKTTTTAMLAKIFLDAGLDPTVVVGSLLIDQKSNFIAGNGKYFIAEACEYKRSFLNLSPQALIITNIDNDHLDYYKDLADIQSAFAELVIKIPADGYLVCDKNDSALAPVLAMAKCQVLNYGELLGSGAAKLKLRQAGEHNRKDAAAALVLAKALGVPEDKILASLANFAGTWRRFEYKGEVNGVKIYDDYAHHPTEIKATLAGAREMVGKDKKITVVFQPHLYSRTKLLFNDFASAFKAADEVILTDIYAAREVDDGTINSAILAEAIAKNGTPSRHIADFGEIENILREEIKNSGQAGDLVITMGAGEAYKIGEEIVKGKE